ncbi:hypothetical protein SAMN05446037_100691 [Anaerovirgula multivorans]|uniref:Capsid protein n=1 Tax=Anaerovirgula multivorans TaxID=312168 RepID=A0A239CQT6_9FIRM|nr:hypothetical protein [Anaerovirgula multivorans]SNS22212.1 hypothetical protein SAMN05446037_100691 [Anaerovirgula multivorans]
MPVVQRLHIDKALSNISIGYSNEQYIGDKIFKPIVVNKQSDRFYVYGMERFRTNDDHRAPGTEANEINWTFSDESYFAEGHALRHAIADEEKQNADDEFNLETEGTELVTEGILMNKEVDAANKVLNPNAYHADLRITLGAAGAPAKWSDYTNSDPILDVQKAREAIHKKSGLRANTIIMSEPVMNVLKLHPKLVDIIKYVQKGIVTTDLMSTAFGVDQILVGSALVSSVNNPGQVEAGQLEPLDYIWGNSVVLAYIPSRPGKKTAALAYSFMWNKDGAGPVQVRKWYETSRRATVVEAERWFDQRMISNVAGFLFSDAVVPLGTFS